MKRIMVISAILVLMPFASAMAEPNCTTKDGYFAALTEDMFDQATNYAVQKDYVALKKLLDTGLVIMLKPGVKVYIDDQKIFSGIVKIRPAGSTVSVWTNIEAVDCH